jgi:RHH-type proline utilization regulon transcriptional repressor/proline dehydrogenase/delta 1-pyrroline-5-carboxylate dehydrogenase
VPPGVLQLLPGRGETVGAQLTADNRVRGVMFTGSTEVASLLQRNIATAGCTRASDAAYRRNGRA